jgi:hypothetical protein
MSSFQQSAAATIDERLNLLAQLCELERLREQVRKAELARRSLRVPYRRSTVFDPSRKDTKCGPTNGLSAKLNVDLLSTRLSSPR